MHCLRVIPSSSSRVSEPIINRISIKSPIWEGGSRTVVEISDGVVVKVGKDLEHDEIEQVPGVPSPQALGLVTVGLTSYMEVKQNLQTTLDRILQLLRSVAVPHAAPLGSPCGQHLRKDVRMSARTSSSSIYSEDDFNDFLFTSPSSRVSQRYRYWLCSLMRGDHRIVLTHGDFYPRNIIVTDEPDGVTTISGIIDWETGSFYLEHWELLKAVNTRAITDPSDWWDYLPEAMLGYELDAAVDRPLERTGIC
ncbi:kinase-like protein [Armillaria nabsnona]|nr:kinase-like protein [Armillaria nabsnona]